MSDPEIHTYRLHLAQNVVEVNGYNMATISVSEEVIFNKFKVR